MDRQQPGIHHGGHEKVFLLKHQHLQLFKHAFVEISRRFKLDLVIQHLRTVQLVLQCKGNRLLCLPIITYQIIISCQQQTVIDPFFFQRRQALCTVQKTSHIMHSSLLQGHKCLAYCGIKRFSLPVEPLGGKGLLSLSIFPDSKIIQTKLHMAVVYLERFTLFRSSPLRKRGKSQIPEETRLKHLEDIEIGNIDKKRHIFSNLRRVNSGGKEIHHTLLICKDLLE